MKRNNFLNIKSTFFSFSFSLWRVQGGGILVSRIKNQELRFRKKTSFIFPLWRGLGGGKIILFLSILCYLSTNINSQVTATATVDTKEILIGEQVELELNVTHPENIEVEWPFLVQQIDTFEIVNNTKIDTTLENNVFTETQKIYLTAWDTGYHVLKPIRFKYKDGRNQRFAQTPAQIIHVSTVPIDSTNQQAIRDIAPIIPIDFHWSEYAHYIFIPLVVWLIIALLIYLFIKYRRDKKEKLAYVPPPLPAHEVAFTKLRALEKEKLWEKGELKKYYSELTDIIREYLERRFDILAMESTSDEIIKDLQSTDIQKAMLPKLKTMFRLADLAKFAKAQPSMTDNKKSLKDAFDIVTHTKFKVESE